MFMYSQEIANFMVKCKSKISMACPTYKLEQDDYEIGFGFNEQ